MLRRFLPFSSIIFVITAFSVMLQFVPLVQILTLIFLPTLTPILINIGMLCLSFEALLGKVYRIWLLLPLTFYGSYYYVAIPQQFEAKRLLASYDEVNASVEIPFDINTDALVVGGSVRSDLLIREYELPIIYTTSSGYPQNYNSVRWLNRRECAMLKERLPNDSDRIRFQWYDAEGKSSQEQSEGVNCLFEMPETIAGKKLFAISQPGASAAKGFDASRLNVTIKSDNGRIYTLLGGIARPLPWVPLPIVDCLSSWLAEEAAHQSCKTYLLREKDLKGWYFVDAEKRTSHQLAKSLRLLQRRNDGIKPEELARVLARLEVFRESEIAILLNKLDKKISNPKAKIEISDLDKLAVYPGRLAIRSKGMMALLEAEVKYSHPTSVGQRYIAELVAALPDREFIEIGPRVLALFSNVGQNHWLWDQRRLVGRIGILGPSALSALTSPYRDKDYYGHGWLEGLCLVGAPGRNQAQNVIDEWQNGAGDTQAKTLAAFIAMRRMGITPPELESYQQKKFGPLLKKWAHVTPSSSPSVCNEASKLLEEQEKSEAKKSRGQYLRELDSRY